jgi:hypothetical protein
MQYRGVAPIDRARDDDRRQAPHISSTMAQSFPCQMTSEITQKWRALAAQRHDHFLELHRTGRWKLYYSEHDFLVRMRETVHLLDMWNALTTPAATLPIAEEKRASTV